ncbi:hypothetical protein [Pueribacillus sp. YX66]|uniref:hypothetical protein n=1 Tax=Pueribacillus sp. YX66 TaxID=3229242 RepID=UPI00358D2927
MKHEKNSVIYLGTIIGLIVFIIIMFAINASFTQFLYTALGMGVFISIIIIADKILPKVWLLGILLGIGVGVFHLFSQSWTMTIILVIMALLFLYLNLNNERKRWGSIVLVGMVTVASLSILFMVDHHKLPTVDEKIFQSTMNEMNRHPEIMNAVIGIEDDTIYCSLHVNDTLTRTEKEQLGEMCAKTLATTVSQDTNIKGPSDDDLGELYDYYVLEIMIGTDNENDEIIFARKHTNNKGFTW